MGSFVSNLQEVQDLHFLLKRNGHTTTRTEVEDLVHTIRDVCPWIPEEGTLDLKEWSKIGSCLQGHPRVTAKVLSTCCKVRTCLQGLAPPRNILFDQEFENNLFKQLPQILPPLPLTPAPSVPLLDSLFHSAQPTEPQPGNTSALSPSPAVHQATENKISNCPLMDTMGAALETAYPGVQGTQAQAQGDAAAVSHSSELLPYQGVRELQLSLKDKQTQTLPESSSAQRPAPSDWSRGLLPPAEGLICLQGWQDLATKQAEINAVGSVHQPIIMEKVYSLLLFKSVSWTQFSVSQGHMGNGTQGNGTQGRPQAKRE